MARRPTARVGAGRVAALFVPLAVVAWLSGLPFVFPSLGPSAYVLAVSPDADTSRPARVFGGHLIGLAAGLAAYHLLAPGLVLTTQPAAGSLASGRLAASAFLAVVGTTAGMVASEYRHAPACATTLIVALGLLTTAREAVVVVLAVGALLATDAGLRRIARRRRR
ncbi:HPP family protein [Halosegnis longus]|uniref:HPP family protein n=1 Tax=Halosegnis longus TaxID=2216012 RepID=A0AAJ4R7E7_9EURY|nr:HPP family protein [Salella cibi]